MDNVKFHRAAYYAISLDEIPEDRIADLTPINEIVETHEPVANYRPLDAMSRKPAGREENTPWGPVVVRKNVSRDGQKRTMYIGRDETRDVTLIGWGN